MNRIVVFGAGRFLEERISLLKSLRHTKIVLVTDNDKNSWGKEKFGYKVENVSSLYDIEYDFVVIVSSYACDIRKQLMAMNVANNKIKDISDYAAFVSEGQCILYDNSIKKITYHKKSILAAVPMAEFNGAVLATIYLLQAMMKLGYKVGMIAPYGERGFIDYASSCGIQVAIYPCLVEKTKERLKWIDEFDYLIFSSVMLSKSVIYHKDKKVMWWLHEPEIGYESEIRLHGDFDETQFGGIPIYCVSNIAQKAFKKRFTTIDADLLEFGLPDFYVDNYMTNHSKITIAVIADIYLGKGQDIFLDAIRLLSREYVDKCEFWLIGRSFDDSYCKSIKEKAKRYPVKFLGKVDHKRIENLYSDIDVLVCPSRYDTMSISAIEGLMNKKVTIISDAAGVSEYVSDGNDAYVFKSEDYVQLADIISEVIDDFETLDDMRESARKLYEKVFSMEAFSERLKRIFEE